MALFDTTRPHGSDRSVLGRMNFLTASAIGSLTDWNDTRQTRSALGKMSNRELDDLGLTRADIEYMASRRGR